MAGCGECGDCGECERWKEGEEVAVADEDCAEEVGYDAVFTAFAVAVSSAGGEEESDDEGWAWRGRILGAKSRRRLECQCDEEYLSGTHV